MELTIVIPVLVFSAVSALAILALSNPQGVKRRILTSFSFLERHQARMGLGSFIPKYDEKISLAGLSGGELSGARVLAMKELLAIAVFLIAIGLSIPLLLAVWLGAGGFFLPDLYLKDKRAKRHREVVRSLPDLLDMLTLVMEAGLDFGSALSIILQKGRKNVLLEELEIASKEMRLGVPRAQALQNLAGRLKIQDVNVFVAAVLNAEQMGTSMAAALRVQAGASRERRMQRAEKLALEAPVKMIFPLVFFIFPVIFIVLIGPIIMQWMKK